MPRMHLQHLSEPNSDADPDDDTSDMAQPNARPGTFSRATLERSSLKWTAVDVEAGA